VVIFDPYAGSVSVNVKKAKLSTTIRMLENRKAKNVILKEQKIASSKIFEYSIKKY
jgi:hypothetical protein